MSYPPPRSLEHPPVKHPPPLASPYPAQHQYLHHLPPAPQCHPPPINPYAQQTSPFFPNLHPHYPFHQGHPLPIDPAHLSHQFTQYHLLPAQYHLPPPPQYPQYPQYPPLLPPPPHLIPTALPSQLFTQPPPYPTHPQLSHTPQPPPPVLQNCPPVLQNYPPSLQNCPPVPPVLQNCPPVLQNCPPVPPVLQNCPPPVHSYTAPLHPLQGPPPPNPQPRNHQYTFVRYDHVDDNDLIDSQAKNTNKLFPSEPTKRSYQLSKRLSKHATNDEFDSQDDNEGDTKRFKSKKESNNAELSDNNDGNDNNQAKTMVLLPPAPLKPRPPVVPTSKIKPNLNGLRYWAAVVPKDIMIAAFPNHPLHELPYPWYCQICEQIFGSSTAFHLGYHAFYTSPICKMKCDDCELGFHSITAFTSHPKSQHHIDRVRSLGSTVLPEEIEARKRIVEIMDEVFGPVVIEEDGSKHHNFSIIADGRLEEHRVLHPTTNAQVDDIITQNEDGADDYNKYWMHKWQGVIPLEDVILAFPYIDHLNPPNRMYCRYCQICDGFILACEGLPKIIAHFEKHRLYFQRSKHNKPMHSTLDCNHCKFSVTRTSAFQQHLSSFSHAKNINDDATEVQLAMRSKIREKFQSLHGTFLGADSLDIDDNDGTQQRSQDELIAEIIKNLTPSANGLRQLRGVIDKDLIQEAFPNSLCSYYCQICEQVFAQESRRHLLHHELYKSSTAPIKCDLCELGFTSQSVFHRHPNSNAHCEAFRLSTTEVPPEQLKAKAQIAELMNKIFGPVIVAEDGTKYHDFTVVPDGRAEKYHSPGGKRSRRNSLPSENIIED